MKDISNANWWGKSFGAFGWNVHLRIRRKERRQTNRRWLKLEVYNYNYSHEAREKNRKNAELLGQQNDGSENDREQ